MSSPRFARFLLPATLAAAAIVAPASASAAQGDITISDATVTEAPGFPELQFYVEREFGDYMTTSTEVSYQVVGIGAQQGPDYGFATETDGPSDGKITFPAGDGDPTDGGAGGASYRINIPVFNDAIHEETESVYIYLDTPTGSGTVTDGAGVGTIFDDDPCNQNYSCMGPADNQAISDFFGSFGSSVDNAFDEIDKKVPIKETSPMAGLFDWTAYPGYLYYANGTASAKGDPLGTASVSVAQPGPIEVEFRLTKAGRKHLRKKPKGRATLVGTRTDPSGATRTYTRLFKYKRKKKD